MDAVEPPVTDKGNVDPDSDYEEIGVTRIGFPLFPPPPPRGFLFSFLFFSFLFFTFFFTFSVKF